MSVPSSPSEPDPFLDPAATCESWIPAGMRHTGELTPDDFEGRKSAYRARRSRQTRTFRHLGLASICAFVIGFLLAGLAAPASSLGNLGGMLVLLSLSTLLIAGCVYLALRRNQRVDEFEEDFGTEVDRFPPNRLVPPDSPTVQVVFGVLAAVLAGSAPWILAGSRVGEGLLTWSPTVLAVAATLSVILAVLVAVGVWRWHHEGFADSPAGLRVTGLAHQRTVPWDEVATIGIRRMTARNRYASSTTAQLFVRTLAGEVFGNAGVSLATATRHERERTRHNIRVAEAWAERHHLPADPGLQAGVEYAQGRISAADLVSRADAEDVSS